MCTVVVEVPQSRSGEVRLLAVRDEDPARPWDPLGRWWPEHPGVVGVRDRLAGGAWLAAAPEDRRLAVVLNRAGAAPGGIPAAPLPGGSRGALVLDAAAGAAIPARPDTAAFTLLSVHGARVEVVGWDGAVLSRSELEPGVHMIAHHEVDDVARTPRIARWLPGFRELGGLPDEAWRARWIARLAESAELPATDDRAIIRDNRPHGYPTLSLLVCLAALDPRVADPGAALLLDAARLRVPGRWDDPRFERFGAETLSWPRSEESEAGS